MLPAFTSVDTMRAWDPAARPIPASGERVALAAAGEGTDLVVLDADQRDRGRHPPARAVGDRAP